MEETLGKRIMAHRKRLGLTQDKLAELTGVTPQAVSKWENDQSCPDITTLPQLADIFDTTVDALLGREISRQTPPAEGAPEGPEEETPQGSGMEWYYEGGRKDALMLAVLVLLVGALTFFSRLYSWDVSFWNILWPSSILMLGLGTIFKRFSCFGAGCALLGGYFLLDNLHVIRWDLSGKLVFPILVLVFGAMLLVDALTKPRHPRHTFRRVGKNGKSQNHYSVGEECFTYSLSFGEDHRQVTLPRLAEGDISCSFGEMSVDLTTCEEFAPGCTVKALCSFGELELLVPRSVRVERSSSTAFAQVDVHGAPEAGCDAVLYLDARVSFGQIAVRYI